MIVYNVQRGWFAMKADAEAFRKSAGLPPSATYKISVSDREELVALLSLISGREVPEGEKAPEVAPEAVMAEDEPWPDWIPAIFIRDWQKRRKTNSNE